jgi:DNA-binding response OmpR family regulator
VARILIVEDHADIAALIRHYLERAGHTVEHLDSGRDVPGRVRQSPPNLIVLDVMLPGLDGLLVCQALRAEPATAAIPIIMLTARGEEADRVRGLELGADDYITKPFSPRELPILIVTARGEEIDRVAGLEGGADDYIVKPFSPKELVARVAALLRRVERPVPAAKVMRYGPLSLDLDRHQVLVNHEEVRLTAKEFLLLQYLLEHSGRVLSRDLLLSDVWGYQYTGGTRTVDVHVRRLREKIPLLATALTTIKQFGYKLEDPPVSS